MKLIKFSESGKTHLCVERKKGGHTLWSIVDGNYITNGSSPVTYVHAAKCKPDTDNFYVSRDDKDYQPFDGDEPTCYYCRKSLGLEETKATCKRYVIVEKMTGLFLIRDDWRGAKTTKEILKTKMRRVKFLPRSLSEDKWEVKEVCIYLE